MSNSVIASIRCENIPRRLSPTTFGLGRVGRLLSPSQMMVSLRSAFAVILEVSKHRCLTLRFFFFGYSCGCLYRKDGASQRKRQCLWRLKAAPLHITNINVFSLSLCSHSEIEIRQQPDGQKGCPQHQVNKLYTIFFLLDRLPSELLYPLSLSYFCIKKTAFVFYKKRSVLFRRLIVILGDVQLSCAPPLRPSSIENGLGAIRIKE